MTENNKYGNRQRTMADKSSEKKKAREKRLRQERSQRLQRDEAESHCSVAVTHYENKNIPEARRSLQKALRVNPKHLSAHKMLAQIALEEKNFWKRPLPFKPF